MDEVLKITLGYTTGACSQALILVLADGIHVAGRVPN
jgi:hypothetical protein